MDELQQQVEQLRKALGEANDEDREAMLAVIEDLENLIENFSTVADNAASGSQSQVSVDEDEFDLFNREIAQIQNEFKDDEEQTEAADDTEELKPGAALYDEDEEDEDADDEGSQSQGKNKRTAQRDKMKKSAGSAESDDEPEICTNNDASYCIKNELEELDGMKCLAPHEESWGQIGFYPAMISQVVGNEDASGGDETLRTIMVRVVFLQPVVKSQLLCPFFQADGCKYDDCDCVYSHGEVVPLSQLREYREPDFSKVVPSARVLAKFTDNLWYSATVIRLTSDGNCEVKFDLDNEICEVGIHEVDPKLSDDESSSSSSDSNHSAIDEESDSCGLNLLQETLCGSSSGILNMTATESLGDWEKYTKGFGSKLMVKMGYVMGSGLGKQSEGRVQPVDAVIVPPGMSLDTFMEMKEKRKGGHDWFSVEKKLKRAHKKHSQEEKAQETHKRQNQSTVFDFMNSRLSLCKPKHSHSQKPNSVNIGKETAINLKKEMFRLGESMKKVNMEIAKVKQSMIRMEGKDPATLEVLKNTLNELEKSKEELTRKEARVSNEQKSRSDKKKLLEF